MTHQRCHTSSGLLQPPGYRTDSSEDAQAQLNSLSVSLPPYLVRRHRPCFVPCLNLEAHFPNQRANERERRPLEPFSFSLCAITQHSFIDEAVCVERAEK